MPDLWRWGVQEMRTNPLWHQKTTREEGLRRILGMGIIGAAIVASGGAALVPIAIGAGIGGGIAYGAQVWGNYQHGLRGPAMWKHIDWWAVAQGAFHGAVSAAAAELIAPLLPSGGTGLAGVLETGISEFIGGRATQVALNVVSGRDPDADLWNLLDIALDVVPGMAVAGLREWKAARQADDAIRAARQADLPSANQFDDAARQLDVDSPKLLPAGEPTSLANQSDRLLSPGMRYAPPESGIPRDLQDAIAKSIRETDTDYAAFRGMVPGSEQNWAGKFPAKPLGAKTLPNGHILDAYGRDTGLRRVELLDTGEKFIVRTDLDPAWAIRNRQGIPDDKFMDPVAGMGPAVNRNYRGLDDPIVGHGNHIEGVRDPDKRAKGASPAYLTHPVYIFGPHGYIESGPMRQTYQRYRLGQ